MELYTYFRSSASYRVRIALNLKGLAATPHAVHLTRDGGAHRAKSFGLVNPERLVPVLRDGGASLAQSLAIMEYLDETHPQPPLLPGGPQERAWVRGLALLVSCDIHPLNNLRVLQYLDETLRVPPAEKQRWVQHWIATGFDALEARLSRDGRSGSCCFGDSPTLADCCLVPQVFNARRFGVTLDAYPTLNRIDAHLASLDAFRQAAPGVQPDAE